MSWRILCFISTVEFSYLFLFLSLFSAQHFLHINLCLLLSVWMPTQTVVVHVSSITCSVCSVFVSLAIIGPSRVTHSAFSYSHSPFFEAIFPTSRLLRQHCTMLLVSKFSCALSHASCWSFSFSIVIRSLFTHLLLIQNSILNYIIIIHDG